VPQLKIYRFQKIHNLASLFKLRSKNKYFIKRLIRRSVWWISQAFLLCVEIEAVANRMQPMQTWPVGHQGG